MEEILKKNKSLEEEAEQINQRLREELKRLVDDQARLQRLYNELGEDYKELEKRQSIHRHRELRGTCKKLKENIKQLSSELDMVRKGRCTRSCDCSEERVELEEEVICVRVEINCHEKNQHLVRMGNVGLGKRCSFLEARCSGLELGPKGRSTAGRSAGPS